MSKDGRIPLLSVVDEVPAKLYCGQCGQMVDWMEAVKCPSCRMATCRECNGQVEKCWYCGEEMVMKLGDFRMVGSGWLGR